MTETEERVETNPDTAFERSDWPIGTVGLVLLGTFLFLVIAPLVLIWAYPAAVSDVSRRLTVAPPAPRLEIDAAADLKKFRAEETKRLDGYYWVDKQKGIVHIPISLAMQKLAKEGIPGFPKGKPP